MKQALSSYRWAWVVGALLAGRGLVVAEETSPPMPPTPAPEVKESAEEPRLVLPGPDGTSSLDLPPPPPIPPVSTSEVKKLGTEETQAAAPPVMEPADGEEPKIMPGTDEKPMLPATEGKEDEVADPSIKSDRDFDYTNNPSKLLERPTSDEDDPTSPPDFLKETYKGEPKYPDLSGKYETSEPQFLYKLDPPLGWAGKSSVARTVIPNAHFVPIEDRWRMGFPEWDRYDRGFAIPDDYPFERGAWYDPFQQNVLKSDYPIIGQHIFLNMTLQSLTLVNSQQTPIPTTPFEATATPFQEEFFGSPNQLFATQFFKATFNLFHGSTTAFRPFDWSVQVTPVFNMNTLAVDETAVVNPNVSRGLNRDRGFIALEEYFVETKLADLTPDYDFLSLRVGSQFFNADFRGFNFIDTNRGVRLFGNYQSNRIQYNMAYFRQAEKDTNSGLNTFDDRGQNIFIGNVFVQDFVWPGHTVLFNVLYNNDNATRRFNKNSFRVRPDNAGVFQPHDIDVVYFGFGQDGHIGRYNITSQFYYALGHDTQNPIANRAQDISAGMGAVELSYDRDWVRFRMSGMWMSGDENPNDTKATGWDGIFDCPNFAGGGFSYFNRQSIGLFGIQLTNGESFTPNLRSSKTQGQTNFVNPGILLLNFGLDFDITPRLKLIHNTNFIWFDNVATLETFVFAGDLDNRVGTDISLGVEYRPLASNNVVFLFGLSGLVPGSGFKALYNKLDNTVDTQLAAFMQTILQY